MLAVAHGSAISFNRDGGFSMPVGELRSRAHTSQLEPFVVRSWRVGRARVVALSGELDLATAGDVARELDDAQRSGAQGIILDLRELTFIDCSGLRVILAAHHGSAGRLTIVKGPARVQRVFELCDLTDLLVFVDQPPGCAEDSPSTGTSGHERTAAAKDESRALGTRAATARRAEHAALAAAVRQLRSRGQLRPIR
jgi:anti-sigma B factor antagonist